MPGEMFGPEILARMKQPHDAIGFWINAGEVRSFLFIAAQAGPRQICCGCRPVMLLCTNVINLERQLGQALWKMTIFAAENCAAPHQSVESRPHRYSGRRLGFSQGA